MEKNYLTSSCNLVSNCHLFKMEHPLSQVTVGRVEADQRLVEDSMVLLEAGVVLLEAGAVLLNAGVVLLKVGAVLLEAGVVLLEAGAVLLKIRVPCLHLDEVGLQLLKLLADIDLCEAKLLFG
jgi:hypothetical protein